MEELISIVMPTFNVEEYVADAIKSIINQTYSHWELLITDDCSTDNTVNIINSFVRNDSRIKLFSLEKNCGAGAARNNSIDKANGRFIAFCDSDDWWYPYKLEIQYNFMKINCYEFVYSASEYANSNLEVVGVCWKRMKVDHRSLLYDSNVGTPGVIYDTKRIGKLYFSNIRKRQDWAMWLNIIEKTEYLYCINWPLWKHRIRDGSLTSSKINLVKYNIDVYTKILGFSKFKAYSLFMFAYMPNFIYRNIKNRIDSQKYLNNYF